MVIESKKKLASTNQKIFTCAELENKVVKSPATPKTPRKIANLKKMDSAIMQFSSKNSVTRYQKAELMTLKEKKAAKAPPTCQFDPRVISLNILINKAQEQKPEELHSSLQNNNSMENFDPNLISLLETYHKSLIPPQDAMSGEMYQNSPLRGNSPKFSRRVSWGDRNDCKNFFNDIRTNCPRMGVGSLDPQKTRGNQSNVRSAKGFACSNERNNFYPKNLSAGSISFNESKSSYDGSSEKDHSKSTGKDEEEVDGKECEPEWYTCPASQHDLIDLHGFDEDDNLQMHVPKARSSDVGTKKMFDEFASFDQRNHERNEIPGNRRPNNYRFNHGNFNDYSRGKGFYNPPMQSGSSSSFRSFGKAFDNRYNAHNQQTNEFNAISPFFEMWKVKNGQEKVNFFNLMNAAQPQMRTISDIENGTRQQMNPPFDFFCSQQQFRNSAAANNRQSAPCFFQQANVNQFSMNGTNAGGRLPTQEQLEQHTSEILRNAILRKQNQSERKFRK